MDDLTSYPMEEINTPLLKAVFVVWLVELIDSWESVLLLRLASFLYDYDFFTEKFISFPKCL